MRKIKEWLSTNFLKKKDIYQSSSILSRGYWSNLDKDENKKLVAASKKFGPRSAIKKLKPELEDVIFSSKREGGLELLDLKGTENCVDFGCMWGALTVPLAKRTNYVLGIDQTTNSLEFLNLRLENENIKNVDLLNINLNSLNKIPDNLFDIAIINGVLEWVPEVDDIELKKYYGKKTRKKNIKDINPKSKQTNFLLKVKNSLKDGGKLYLAIENRYDFKMFFGIKDPHSNLLLTSVIPKKLANLVSKFFLNRQYVNWIYSEKELFSILKKLGFKNIQIHYAFPDYRFPELIFHNKSSLKNFHSTISSYDMNGKFKFKRFFGELLELIFFKYLKLKFFAPSFIVVVEK